MSHTRLCPLASIEALVFCRIMGYGSEFPVCLYADSDFAGKYTVLVLFW